MKLKLTKTLTVLTISALCSATLLTGCASDKDAKQSSEAPKDSSEETLIAGQTSPMGARKMMDLDGNRFVFMSNGEPINPEYYPIGEELGTVNDGTLYKLGEYSPEFRQVFKYEDIYYIIENVGKSDDSNIDVKSYLETANLENTVVFADVFDHLGSSLLNNLSTEECKEILAIFSEATISDLENSDYETIGKAQAEGDSYQLIFTLEDSTRFTSYVIPSLGYITIGDYTCIVEDLEEKIGHFFENLVVNEPIIMN